MLNIAGTAPFRMRCTIVEQRDYANYQQRGGDSY